MPPPPIDFADYHRTVIGYHGTTVEAADRLVAGDPFEESDEDDEWFGKGIYFWEHAFQQAWWWARRDDNPHPAVIGAVLRLGRCFDLLDTGNVTLLRGFHDKMVADMQDVNAQIPVNVRSHRVLDCAVFNYLYDDFEAAEMPLDTARAVFVPTSTAKRVYTGSWISEETHIQICVRNPQSILAVWHVREDGRYGRPTE
ncbi:MAG: hypothetical protein K8U57_30595 [Planctomycetes bacterium]|nr:hypothetical protein [Planctomycetota bacterium]